MEAAETLDGKLAEYLLLMLRVNPRFAEITQQCEVSPQDKDRVRMAATRATGLRKNDGACLMATCWAIYPLCLCDDVAGPILLNAAVSKAEIGGRERRAWQKARTMCRLYRRRTPGIVLGGENGLRLTPECCAELSKNGADLGLVEAALTMLLKPAE